MLVDRSTRDLGVSLQRIFKNNGFDITVEQWMILLLLWKKNGRTQQEIANIIGKDKGTISPQIDGLEKRELIMRMQDQNDNIFWTQAQTLVAGGHTLEAEKYFREALRFNPFDSRLPVIAQELADLLENLGKPQEAALLREKVAQQP